MHEATKGMQVWAKKFLRQKRLEAITAGDHPSNRSGINKEGSTRGREEAIEGWGEYKKNPRSEGGTPEGEKSAKTTIEIIQENFIQKQMRAIDRKQTVGMREQRGRIFSPIIGGEG